MIIRIILGLLLTVAIWWRIDWSIGLFTFLVLLRVELEDYFFPPLNRAKLYKVVSAWMECISCHHIYNYKKTSKDTFKEICDECYKKGVRRPPLLYGNIFSIRKRKNNH